MLHLGGMLGIDPSRGQGADPGEAGRLSRRAWLRGALAGAALTGIAPHARAEDGAEATSSRRTRDEAVREIPFDKLGRSARSRIDQVLADVTIFRRLPLQVFPCDPTLYLFLLDYPEVVVNIWQVLDMTQVSLERTSATTFRADDGAGSRGTVEVLHRTPTRHLIYSEGAYEGPLFQRPLRGRCVLLLSTDYVRGAQSKTVVRSRLDTFIQLDHVAVEAVLKTFQPLVGKLADHNFRETASFIELLNRTAEQNPPGIERLAERLTSVPPEARERFVEVALAASQRAQADLPPVR